MFNPLRFVRRLSRAKTTNRRRLLIESLEDRRLMATRIWDGGVARNDQWTERRNWVGNVAPVAGDNLIFPDSIRFTDRGLNNDFPTGTEFNDITFEGEGYLIRGNRIDLTGDITYAPRSDIPIGDSKLNLEIRFEDGGHRIQLVAGAVEKPELEFNGRLTDTGGGDIRINGVGDVIFGGPSDNVIDGHAIVLENSSGDDEIKLLLDKDDNVVAIDGPLFVGLGGNVEVGKNQFSLSSKVGQLTSGIDLFMRPGAFVRLGRETIGELRSGGGVVIIEDIDVDVIGELTLTDTVTITGNTDIRTSAGGEGRLRLNPASQSPRELRVSANASLEISAILASGNLLKTDDGALFLRPNANNAHGTSTIDEGYLFLGSSNANANNIAGRTVIPSDLIVRNTGRIVHDGNSNVIADTANVILSDGGRFEMAGGREETIRGLSLNSNSTFVVSEDGTELNVLESSAIRGGSDFIATEGGTVSFLATTTIDSATALADDGSLLFSDVVMTASVVQSANGSNVLLGGDVTTIASDISSEFQGELVLLPGEHRFLVANGGAVNDLAIQAIIQERGGIGGANSSLRKFGEGQLLFTRNNVYTGKTTVLQGTLLINGQHSVNQDEVAIFGGALAGRGRVSSLRLNGGTFSPGAGVGRFTVNTATRFIAGSKTVVQINGPVAGADFDQLVTNELFVLPSGGERPVLDLKLGFVPNLGQVFRIVNVLGTGVLPANQFFESSQEELLSEGATFQLNGLDFTITYQGGNGNDINIVRNSGPAFINRHITPSIVEGQVAVLTGTITEENARDTFLLDVDWGDGRQQTFTFPPGSSRDVRLTHRYLDDSESNPADRYLVKLVWRDQHGGGNRASLPIVVQNAAPQFANLAASVPIVVNQPTTITGRILDAGLRDTHRVLVQWEVGGAWEAVEITRPDGRFRLNHTYSQAGSHRVSLLLLDDDLGFASETFLLHVANG